MHEARNPGITGLLPRQLKCFIYFLVSDLIEIQNNFQNSSIQDSIFQENKLNDNINIQNSWNFSLSNTSCIRNNNKTLNRLNGGGTCFVFRYVNIISFNYVTISDSFNDHTAVGVKLIESQVILIFL